MFFADFLQDCTPDELSHALADLLLNTRMLRLLGQYEPALERIKQGIDPALRAEQNNHTMGEEDE